MKNGKYSKRGGVASKALVLTLVLMLVIGCSVGGTIAWLTDQTDAVVNTFTVGDIDITLSETWNTDTDGDNKDDAWSAILVPGTEYTKDPVVTVIGGSEDCYLFVKFEEINNPATYLTYTSTLTAANGWTQGNGASIPANVWYREVTKSESDTSWNLLDGNKVTVKASLTKATMPADNAAPSLIYTAYAVQKDNLTVEQAWAEAIK